ncbi:MAG TPA: potassium/proton antiporter [Gemmatimonadota bacterium]|jgi:cell volume regulation protein A|nr:potassium/proton antiporter [Gemmatimonadota bacterium]
MFGVDRVILLAAVLLILGIASSKLSSRMGLPVLVLFLLVGMLAGEEGLGGIVFENYELAHGVGTVALALILFDGGLRTDIVQFRAVMAPALTLASVGVLLTAAIVALAAMAVLDLPWIVAFLLASIVSSTDAAAVFAVFRAQGMRVKERLTALLEVESGSNDPMAVFLTIVCLQILMGVLEPGPDIVTFFLRQAILGGLIGWMVGRGTTIVLNRIGLDTAGLYPVLVSAAGLLAFGAAAVAGGSGFLSVYVAGIVLGSRRLPFRQAVFMFHDGVAWLAQILMFTLLGLLSLPSRLVAASQPALLVAGVLVFLARPVAVATCLLPFGFSLREVAFVAWGGLKGSLPIILATYPLLRGLEGAAGLFDVVFFAVLVSAVTQGWTLPYAARALGLREGGVPHSGVMLEITSLQDVDGDIVEYPILEDSRANGVRVRDLALPDGVVIAMIVRDKQVIPPRGTTKILPGDDVFVLLRPAVRALVEHVFGPAGEDSWLPIGAVEFPLRGTTRLGEVEEFYGIHIEAPADQTLDEFLRSKLGRHPTVGDRLASPPITFTIRELSDDRIETVGLEIDSP